MKTKALLVFALLSLAACSDGGDPVDRSKTIVRGVNYVGVSVTDLDRATQLYAAAGDLKFVEENVLSDSAALDALAGREGVIAKSRLMKSVNAQIKFMEFEGSPDATLAMPAVTVNGPGIAHVCYQAKKETGAYERFLAGGATHRGSRQMVQLSERNPVEYAYAHDHDGIMIEVEHVDVAALNLPEPPKNDYRLRHVALATPDIDRLVDFYSVFLEEENPRRFGWWFWGLSGEVFDMVSGLKDTEIQMAWFQIRNMELEIAEFISHPTELPAEPRPVDAVGYNMIVFDVSDLEAARVKFLEAGGTLVGDVEPMDGGEILFGRDPDGNLLGMQVVAPSLPVSAQNFEGNGT